MTRTPNCCEGEAVTLLNVACDHAIKEVGSPFGLDFPTELTDPPHGSKCGHYGVDVARELKHPILVAVLLICPERTLGEVSFVSLIDFVVAEIPQLLCLIRDVELLANLGLIQILRDGLT